MLSEIAVSVSSFMILHTYFGHHSIAGVGKLVSWISPQGSAESITFFGRCLSDNQDVSCHLLLDSDSPSLTLLGYMPIVPIFYGITLLAALFVGMSEYYLEEDEGKGATSVNSGLRELCGFTTFLLGLSTLAGTIASGLGVILFVKVSGTRPASSNASIGFAELITVFLTSCQLLLTLSFHHQTKKDLGEIEGRIILTDEEAKLELDEKSQIGLLTDSDLHELSLRTILYP